MNGAEFHMLHLLWKFKERSFLRRRLVMIASVHPWGGKTRRQILPNKSPPQKNKERQNKTKQKPPPEFFDQREDWLSLIVNFAQFEIVFFSGQFFHIFERGISLSPCVQRPDPRKSPGSNTTNWKGPTIQIHFAVGVLKVNEKVYFSYSFGLEVRPHEALRLKQNGIFKPTTLKTEVLKFH